MKRYFYGENFTKLVEGIHFNSEPEFRDYITPKIRELLKIKKNQIHNEKVTTQFDWTLSNCADILISSDENSSKILLVIELKLERFINKFYKGNFTHAAKQLHKYCQNTRAPYGLLLTEEKYLIYHYEYSDSNSKPKRKNKIPKIISIEREVAKNTFIDAILQKHSTIYFYLFVVLVLIMAILLNGIIFLSKSFISR